MRISHSPAEHRPNARRLLFLKAAAALGAFVGLSSLLLGGVEAGRAMNNTHAIAQEHSIQPSPKLDPVQQSTIELTIKAKHINVPATEAAHADHTKKGWEFGIGGAVVTLVAAAGAIGAERLRRREVAAAEATSSASAAPTYLFDRPTDHFQHQHFYTPPVGTFRNLAPIPEPDVMRGIQVALPPKPALRPILPAMAVRQAQALDLNSQVSYA